MDNRTVSDEGVDAYYNDEFIPRAHRVGRATLLIAMGLCLLPALYLSFGLGAFPGTGVILGAFLAVAAFAGIVWIVEPVSYFPVLGVCGSYMSFLSGNIGNMRLPVVISCQTAIDAEQGSKKAEVAAVVGIAISVIVNLAFLLVLVVAGKALIDAMPGPMAVALKEYTFPALYGAVLVMFVMNARTRAIALAGVLVAVAVALAPISAVFATTAAGVLGIVVSLAMARRSAGKLAPATGQPG
jgi:hypothetical protein